VLVAKRISEKTSCVVQVLTSDKAERGKVKDTRKSHLSANSKEGARRKRTVGDIESGTGEARYGKKGREPVYGRKTPPNRSKSHSCYRNLQEKLNRNKETYRVVLRGLR